MKTLVIYDSWYHNTRKIAEAIGQGLGDESHVLSVHERPLSQLKGSRLVLVGSPTHGGVPTPAMQDFLDALTAEALQGKLVAAFDTRVTYRWVKVIGFASKRIIKQLEAKGGRPVAEPTGFYVRGKEGPLADGELARATSWGRQLIKEAQTRKELIT